jgi:hypothetical protein
MKKLIHTDNYESFYLDYLEGTLSEAERVAFEEFLAMHPELQVEDDLVILDDAPECMDALEKELLKKPEERVVTSENLDYFAIAKVEAVLSVSEEDQLNKYLSKNPESGKVIHEYEATRLEPSVVVFAEKEGLKQKEIVLIPWKLIAGIASVAALLLLFFQIQTGTADPNTQPIAQKNPSKQHPKTKAKKALEVVEPLNQSQQENNTFVAQKNGNSPISNPSNRSKFIQKRDKVEEHTLPMIPEAIDKNLVGDNKPHHPTILPEVKDNKQPVSPTLNEEIHKAPTTDLASNTGGASNMKNPIPLITNTISENTKTPVDFKTGKATETEKGGFFIKIGKFEVLHKSSKRK